MASTTRPPHSPPPPNCARAVRKSMSLASARVKVRQSVTTRAALNRTRVASRYLHASTPTGCSSWPEQAAVNTSKRSEEQKSELQSLMRNSYAVFCLKKKKDKKQNPTTVINKQP